MKPHTAHITFTAHTLVLFLLPKVYGRWCINMACPHCIFSTSARFIIRKVTVLQTLRDVSAWTPSFPGRMSSLLCYSRSPLMTHFWKSGTSILFSFCVKYNACAFSNTAPSIWITNSLNYTADLQMFPFYWCSPKYISALELTLFFNSPLHIKCIICMKDGKHSLHSLCHANSDHKWITGLVMFFSMWKLSC
jgi:hypothetical protein